MVSKKASLDSLRNVSLFAEGISTRTIDGVLAPSNYIDGGGTLLLNDRFQVDLRIGRGVGSGSPNEHFIGLGLARRW